MRFGRFVFCALGMSVLWGLPADAANRRKINKPLPLRPRGVQADSYELPLRGARKYRLSSTFGIRRHPILGRHRRHQGVDFPMAYGTPVYPARNGVVRFAGWRGGFGRVVELRHSDGSTTVYGHLARYFFVRGQLVNKSMLLGLVGSSGLSTGAHLHFETRDSSGRAFDPRRVISQR